MNIGSNLRAYLKSPSNSNSSSTFASNISWQVTSPPIPTIPDASAAFVEWLQAYTFSDDEPILFMDSKKELWQSLMNKSATENTFLKAKLSTTEYELQHIEYLRALLDGLRGELIQAKVAAEEKVGQLELQITVLKQSLENERTLSMNLHKLDQQLRESPMVPQHIYDELLANHNNLIAAFQVQARVLGTTKADMAKIQGEVAFLRALADDLNVDIVPLDNPIPHYGRLPGPRRGSPASKPGYTLDAALNDGVDEDHAYVWAAAGVENIFIHLYHPGKWAVMERRDDHDEFKVFIWEESHALWYCEDYQILVYIKKEVRNGKPTLALYAQHGKPNRRVRGDLVEELGGQCSRYGPGYATTVSYATQFIWAMAYNLHPEAGNVNADGWVFAGDPFQEPDSPAVPEAYDSPSEQERAFQGSPSGPTPAEYVGHYRTSGMNDDEWLFIATPVELSQTCGNVEPTESTPHQAAYQGYYFGSDMHNNHNEWLFIASPVELPQPFDNSEQTDLIPDQAACPGHYYRPDTHDDDNEWMFIAKPLELLQPYDTLGQRGETAEPDAYLGQYLSGNINDADDEWEFRCPPIPCERF
ncbi:uncharacterized protein EI97DRAFT_440753 [Westerdykella ornata]|uniref:Uncharacterized protein n=1 Tax=Westerdykella ornata TaxID=318751 RepID=A0A6A6JPC3_WESOR|nr:uncharacterized protein EI97DRAFT_440753 [Westerdykella ornata]KAF2278247.1 hypothetical protein EI97DRAFT_440753 [Westerdykella ornata]